MAIVSQSKGLSQIPASVWKRYGVTDPSKLDFKVVPSNDENVEFQLLDEKTGIRLDNGNIGQITGDLSGSLIPDAKGNLVYQVQKPDAWSLGSVLGGAASGLGEIAKSQPMLVGMAMNALAPGLGSALSESLGVSSSVGNALARAGMSAATGGNPLTAALPAFGNLDLGGITGAQALTAVNALKAAESGDWMNALSGAASLSGASSFPIGDTGYTLGDLAKNAQLAQAVLSKNPQAVMNAVTKVAGAVQANSTNTPTEAQVNAQNQDFISGLSKYESTDPNYLLNLAVQAQQSSAQKEQAAIDAHTQDIIKQLEQAGLPQDTKGYWDEEHNVFVPSKFGGTSLAQTSEDVSGNINNMNNWSFDKDTGSWTWTNPDTGVPTVYDYKTLVTGTAQTGADIENKAGAAPSSSGSVAPKSGTPTSGASTAGTSASSVSAAASPTVTRLGVDPLEVLKMKNDVAHINPLEELFGGSIYGHTPAHSAQQDTTSEVDLMKALENSQDTQDYASGGDVHALLQLLRS